MWHKSIILCHSIKCILSFSNIKPNWIFSGISFLDWVYRQFLVCHHKLFFFSLTPQLSGRWAAIHTEISRRCQIIPQQRCSVLVTDITLSFSVWHCVPVTERRNWWADCQSCQNDSPCELTMWDKQVLPSPEVGSSRRWRQAAIEESA